MFSVKMANIGGEEPPVETKSVRLISRITAWTCPMA